MISLSGKEDKPDGKYAVNLLLFFVSISVTTALFYSLDDQISNYAAAGNILLIMACFVLLYLFLKHFRSEILEVSRKVLFILAVILAFVLFVALAVRNTQAGFIYLVPFALIPVLIKTFYDARLALFILLITLMITGLMMPDPFSIIIINIISGIVAILSLSNINRKYKLVFSSVVVTVTYFFAYLAFEIRNINDTGYLDAENLRWFLGYGILVLAGYPFISLFEKKFYFLSDTTLLELSDSGAPLLRRLAEEAPGSYQHSLQVANLAEAASRAVGANVLLTRTGSLYHDVGKILAPKYFIENQEPGTSPHMELDPVESSRVIIRHVEDGIRLAREYKLPVQIMDFIRTHHGTTKAYYFYKKYLESDSSGKTYEEKFAYGGPKPFSRETAIVMMADAVEAASRTIEKYDEESISEMVERTVLFQEHEDQYSDAPLTFRDITDIKAAFKKRLLNIYHTRLAYP